MTMEQLNTAHRYAAKLAATRGEGDPVFIELFERISHLVEQERQKESTLDRARRMAAA